MITWIYGNSGSGKTTLAHKMRTTEIILDGDEMRTIWPGLGFSEADRREQNMRVARLAKMLNDQDFDVIVATICPYRDLRDAVQQITDCRFIYLEGGKNGEDYPFEV